MIPFNIPPIVGNEEKFIQDTFLRKKFCGDGYYNRACCELMENRFNSPHAYLTPSCTHSLEMAALLLDIKPGDEVIMPSYTFVSTANAFVLRGATVVFVDIRPDTMNIDETLIEDAITDKTKAIVPVHYAGVGCDMDTINEIAARHQIPVVEDAAQGVMSTYRGKALGTIGDLGCYSFHETKNYSCGEGGAILVNDSSLAERAEIVREKGTNRSRFFRGQVDKYTWVDLGSSLLLGELSAAFLYGQLLEADKINENRLSAWNSYYDALGHLAADGRIDLPTIPRECQHNAHMFYLKAKDLEERSQLIAFLKDNGVNAVFHYLPLHTAEGGLKFGRFHGEDRYTTSESERLVRLPLFYGISSEDQSRVVDAVVRFYRG